MCIAAATSQEYRMDEWTASNLEDRLWDTEIPLSKLNLIVFSVEMIGCCALRRRRCTNGGSGGVVSINNNPIPLLAAPALAKKIHYIFHASSIYHIITYARGEITIAGISFPGVSAVHHRTPHFRRSRRRRLTSKNADEMHKRGEKSVVDIVLGKRNNQR